MSSNIEYNGSSLLRTQSYLVNGKVNPLSDICRKKYFSNYLNIYSQGKSFSKKGNSSKGKKYINKIKNLRQKKHFYSNNCKKKNVKKFNTEENKKGKSNNQYSKFSLNYTAKEKDFRINKENKTLNDFSNEKDHFIKTKINEDSTNNKLLDNKKESNLFNSNSSIKKSKNNKKQFCLQRPNQNKYREFDNSNLINDIFDNKIFSKTTKFNNFLRNIKHNNSNKNNNIIIKNNYSTFSGNNKIKKIFKPIQKDKSYITKIFSNNEDDFIDINYTKNANKLLHKFNYFNKRENYVNNNFKNENTTKDKLKLMKKLINKTPLYNTNIISPPNNNNIYENNFIKKNNFIFNRNNNFSPILTDYNINHDANFLIKDKDRFSRSLSNFIHSMKDERNTNKFIKELNKNNKNYISSKKKIYFSFDKEKTEDWDDEFFYPLKSKINKLKYNY